MYNRVILIGRLTADPNLTYSGNGTAICKFTLAVNRKFNKEETDFLDCICFKGSAENAASFLKKGSLCAVEGRIQIRPYETKDGQKRKATEIVADDVRFLDSKKSAKPSSAPADDWSDVGTELPNGGDSEPW